MSSVAAPHLGSSDPRGTDDPESVLRRVAARHGLWAGLLAVAFFGLFFRWFLAQNRHSLGAMADWGHAYFVPLIALYLLWQNRASLASAVPTVFWPGLSPLLLGIMCYLFFSVGAIANHMLQGVSIVLTLFGVLLFLLGPGVMRPLFLPLAYLVFAITISERIMIGITFQLQIIAAYGAWIVLSAIGFVFGFQCDLKGNIIHVITSTGDVAPLNVAEACSGMRMVIAFFALAAATALLGCRHWWQRIALLLLATPVAVVINIARVAILGLLTLIDPRLAAGEAHTLIGTLLLVPGLGLFLLIVWALNRVVRRDDAAAKPSAAGVRVPRAAARPARLGLAFGIALAILGGSAAGIQGAINAFRLHLQKMPIYAPEGRVVRALPAETEQWVRVGADSSLDAETELVLGTENHVTRTYVEKRPVNPEQPRAIQVHAAYYTGMIDTVPHVPERCFTGAGLLLVDGPWIVDVPLDMSDWTLHPDAEPGEEVLSTRLSNEFSSGGKGMRVRLPRGLTPDRPLQLRVSKYVGPDGTAMFAGYFFLANGGWVSSAEDVRLLAFNLTNDYAYYMKVQVNSAQAASKEELAAAAGSLLSDLLGELMRCVPDWVEVEAGRYPADNPRAVRRTGG